MGFRERPEYQDWREAVFRLFGQKCIRCGHAGNIHAHHVMPVEDYPELAFEPTNGVPLCGNCHVALKGDEMAHVDELKLRQRAILGGETGGEANTEQELRERAFAKPIDPKAVGQWFSQTADSQGAIDFYREHRQQFTDTLPLFLRLSDLYERLERWQDVIEVAGKGIVLCQQGAREKPEIQLVVMLALRKSLAHLRLAQLPEAVAFLRDFVARFTGFAELHGTLSTLLTISSSNSTENHKRELLEEAVSHAIKATEPAPDNSEYLLAAARLSRGTSDYASALRYAKRALTLSTTDVAKAEALQSLAETYMAYGPERGRRSSRLSW